MMYIFQEPQKSKRRGRPSKKDKRNEIPEDVMEAMREVNGLRGRRSNKVWRQLFVTINPTPRILYNKVKFVTTFTHNIECVCNNAKQE